MRLQSTLLLLLLTSVPALAQGPMPGMGLPQGAAPAPMQPAPPETLLADIVLPEGLPTCVGIEAPAEPVPFGEPVNVVLWFAEEGVVPPAELATTEAAWLHSGAFSPGEDPHSLILSLRPYALDFFQLRVGEALGPVVAMAPSGADLSQPASVTLPHLWKTRWWLLLILAVALALILWGLGRLWSRRRQLEPLRPWPCAAPAWLEAAPRLRHLLDEDRLAATDTHLFCDRLAGLIRRFLAQRYLVAATEMTAPEIQTGLAKRGYEPGEARDLIRLIKELDYHRYAPQPPTTGWCREQASAFFKGMAEVRIVPRYTRVAPEILREAEKAWASLTDSSGRASADPARVGGAE